MLYADYKYKRFFCINKINYIKKYNESHPRQWNDTCENAKKLLFYGHVHIFTEYYVVSFSLYYHIITIISRIGIQKY